MYSCGLLHPGLVTMVAHSPLQESPPPRQGFGSVAHWPQSLFYKFKRHMTKWSKAHPHTNCAPIARADMILNEITHFVQKHPRKEREIDPWEQALRGAVIANPRSPYALHDWAAYMGDKEMRGADKALRQLLRNAHHRGKYFFQSLRMWLLTPFRTSCPQHTEGCARRRLPHFSSDPLWEHDKAMSMMNDILRPQEGFKLGNPTWKQFCEVI